jgi:hypothetical protein
VLPFSTFQLTAGREIGALTIRMTGPDGIEGVPEVHSRVSLYKGIIDFPRAAMLGSLVWVPRGLKFWDIKPQTIPRGLPSPKFLNFLVSVGTQFRFASAVL